MIGHQVSDEPLSNGSESSAIPLWFRVVATLIAGFLIVPPTIYFVRYTYEPDRFVQPTRLGLGVVIVAGVILMLVAIAPWHAIAKVFSKLGPIEFAKIINEQTREHAEDFAELRTRVDDLEEKSRGISAVGSVAEHLITVELYPILTRFLQQHSPTAFSPVRIQQWGARQPGFERFAQHKAADIKIVLQRMVADKVATTTVSKLGNTLYRSVN